ncbi:PIN domain-containing protein [Agaribacter flavus]|uniref:PIN domain-containing protein n=1 Tax=Agaribacter flavus TaxID=1902781 RepID=A0ABV7FNI9_9ALTE
MIGIDTNILIRYLAQDDKAQALLASTLIEEKLTANTPGFISMITLVEITWVLQKCYRASKNDLCSTIKMILETKQFQVERAESCYRALKLFEMGSGDFSDALISSISKDAGCSCVMTFDKKAQSVGMELLSN